MHIKQYLKQHVKVIYIIVFLIFFVPRIISLGSDIANFDSSYWYPRMDDFTRNLIKGEYKQTYQKYHPGVTMLWTSGTSKYAFEEAFEKVFDYNPRFTPHQFTRMHFFTKLPLVFLISIIGLFFFILLSKIVDETYALIFAIILSLEPFFLGVSRFLHLSALTSVLMFLSFLTLFYYYHTKKEKRRFFYISSIILAIGMLTKIDAVIAGPVNALLIAYYTWVETKKGKSIVRKVWTIILELLKYGLTAFLTFYALFPSMWVAPRWTIEKIIFDGIKDTAFSSSGAPTLSGIKALYYPEMIVFRSLPTYALGFFLGIGIAIYTYFKKFRKGNTSFLSKKSMVFLAWTLFFIIFNIAILTIPDKIKDRYLINLYPPIAVFTALFVYHAYKSKHLIYKYGVIVIFALFYLLTIYKYHPVYSFYYSELIGGPGGREKLGLPIKNRGEFYAQAALYINKNDSEPEVRNVILSHREQMRTFRPFFIGETFTNPKFMKDGYLADYMITRPDFEYLIPTENCELVKIFGPRDPFGYDIIKLYKCEGIDNSYKDFKN